MNALNRITVREPSDMPNPQHVRGAYIDSLMTKRTAKALASMTPKTIEEAERATLQLVRTYASWGRTAEATKESAEFVAWCALGNLWHTPALDALIGRIVSDSIKAYA